jgi:hypothetical protein
MHLGLLNPQKARLPDPYTCPESVRSYLIIRVYEKSRLINTGD